MQLHLGDSLRGWMVRGIRFKGDQPQYPPSLTKYRFFGLTVGNWFFGTIQRTRV